MNVDEIIKELSPRLAKAIEFFESELANIHTGRASANMVDSIMVEAYGTKQAIKQVANIMIPEPRQILIQPWDKTITGQIENAIRNSNLGFSPVNTGDAVRVTIPELTEERRKDFIKLAREKTEEARVSIRNSRSEAWSAVKKAKNDGEIGEDEMYRGEHVIQTEIDTYNKQVEELSDKKEKELMEI
ncbi:MAG: ribosome recycling factor [Patescibacteria group bacterium]|jgi:ribosome recycling factor|nr:ribosome recycling factor [Patescibacteria group bacterium]